MGSALSLTLGSLFYPTMLGVQKVSSAPERIIAETVRVADGQFFSTVAAVLTTTRNTLVRQLADQANDTLLDHMTVVEKTGLVNLGQVVVQETAASTLLTQDLTPPPPAAGEPPVVLTAPGDASASAR
ncbi:hypothetical protein ACWGKQ_39420 [Streptomyces sp. NPDC054770]